MRNIFPSQPSLVSQISSLVREIFSVIPNEDACRNIILSRAVLHCLNFYNFRVFMQYITIHVTYSLFFIFGYAVCRGKNTNSLHVRFISSFLSFCDLRTYSLTWSNFNSMYLNVGKLVNNDSYRLIHTTVLKFLTYGVQIPSHLRVLVKSFIIKTTVRDYTNLRVHIIIRSSMMLT